MIFPIDATCWNFMWVRIGMVMALFFDGTVPLFWQFAVLWHLDEVFRGRE
jgi:hypothetical protein